MVARTCLEHESEGARWLHEVRGTGGKEASKHSVEVGRKGAAQRRPHKMSTRRIQMHAWRRPRSSAREKDRWGTGGLTAINDHTATEYHTVVFEGLTGQHRGRVPKTRQKRQPSESARFLSYPTVERQHLRCSAVLRSGVGGGVLLSKGNSQQETVVNRRFTRSAQKRFVKRAGHALKSTASRRRQMYAAQRRCALR